MPRCVLKGGRGAFEFDLIPQDNVLCLITKLFQKGGSPYSGGGIVAAEKDQVDFPECHCVV